MIKHAVGNTKRFATVRKFGEQPTNLNVKELREDSTNCILKRAHTIKVDKHLHILHDSHTL